MAAQSAPPQTAPFVDEVSAFYNCLMKHDFNPSAVRDLEHLASQLDRAMASLARTEQRLASPQVTPGETVFRDPKDAYHQITLGAVLVRYGLSAHHARALDGLLAMSSEQLLEFLAELSQPDDSEDDDGPMGLALLELLELEAARLEEAGRYAEWRRGFDEYMARTQPYLDGLAKADFDRLASCPPTKKQRHLIRVTCAYHGLVFPALPDRRAAFEWLRAIGANAKYREVRQ